ncbi:hypothetical protein ISN45_At01g002120 [Arabidopsis thaliana x Arabidopsis arenosa]|uniref:CWZF3/5/7 THD domain-containing protein n=2 Tax=Arabidopsis TaxID=3701 RepID=A0A178W5S9_ARATH|nr:hypothetical protein ISN45_At01g002120 [Arabidopsis thaliana x Arabidopsis arenosa]OAP13434.1 hypothetical protein AXX17_AT1G02200 [Arabidopsis thaliana]
MILVSSSDARSELGLGFGGLGEEIMQDCDFEEESTHSYVSCVDPDVALSYIDEKLENVLGHFQKDFEGGVSAENLGAKFGGYGSFLSMYQRSPVCSRPKTSPEVQQNQLGGRSNCSASSLVPQLSISGSASKPPASDVLVKLNKFVKSSHIGTPDSKHMSDAKTSSSAPSNHKTLRFRIKVGSSDLSSLKNVSTFTKEGLNMLPSASRVNCLSEVEQDLLNGICDSPTKILMAMVSFPLHKDQLLSPLSDDLIQLGSKEKILKDAGYGSTNKTDAKSTPDGLVVSDSQKRAGKFSIGKKEKLRDRVKYRPPSNKLDRNHTVSNTEKEADKESCEELVSKTMKLPLLSCLSPSYIHPAKEIDNVSDSNVESILRGTNKDAALMGSKPELEDNVVAFSDRSVKETESINVRKDVYLIKGEPLNSLESNPKREKAPSIEHVDYSSVVKGTQSETRNEEQILKSKLPKVQRSQKGSSSIVTMNSQRGKDAAVNIIKKNVPDKLQEDIEESEHMCKGFFGDSKESKEEKQISPVLKAEKEKLSEENALGESFNSVKNDEEACDHLNLVCEPDLKHLIKPSDLNEDRHTTKQSVRREVKNKHSLEGGMENMGMESERELSGVSKKPKTGKSRFSAVDQPGSNKSNQILEVLDTNKTMITQALAENVKDFAKASSHGERDDRKRKLKENEESGDCMRLREAAVMESSGENVRKRKRLKGSSCDEKELPFSSESCDKERSVSQENGRDSASHLPSTLSSPSLCKDLGSEIIKNNVRESKGSLVESVAPLALRVLDSGELKSGRISERDEYHDTDYNAGETLKRCRDGEAYSTIDRPGTTKKAAEDSKDRERAYGEDCSIENLKPKKSGRYPGENCIEGDSKQKSREEESSAPSKDNNWGLVNNVQDLGTAVKVKTKESRSKKRPARKVSMECNKEDSREYQDPNTKLDRSGSHFSSRQKPDTANTSRGKSNPLEVTTEQLKNKSASPAQVEVLGHDTEISNTKKQRLRNDNHSVTHDEGSRNQKQNGSRHKDHVGLSPFKKESTSQTASNSIKEATDLKHMADRLKNAVSNHESTGVYFQAALKFLHGASLLESSGTTIARSKDIYGSTAKLCEFCAHEYEKNKDMGAAALAYKCMEVAYLRITYTSHGNIRRCRYELQAALQVIPSGESPSFASDGENSNHTLTAEKFALSNTVRSSPSVTGNHVISSGNNSSLSQLLAFVSSVRLLL